MTAETEHEIAVMLRRCDDLIERSSQLSAENNAVLRDLERVLKTIDAVLDRIGDEL
jgi:hypothetical protein